MHVVGRKKRHTDETIIAALIEAGSIKEAAGKLECTPRTIYDRMKKPAFREAYNQAKGEIMKIATAKLQGEIAASIDTLAKLRDAEDTPKQTRANCAVSILQYSTRFVETTDIMERLEAVEAAQGLRNDEAI